MELRSFYNSSIGKAFFALFLAAVIGIIYFFNPVNYSFYPVCLFSKLTGLYCPGCGSLRALHQLVHGNFLAAFQFNPLLVISLPFLLALFWKQFFGKQTFKSKPSFLYSRFAGWSLLAIILIFAFLRNLPWPAFNWMRPS